MALWQGLAQYIEARALDTVFGVASFHGTDLGRHQNALSYLHSAHLAPPELRVTSRTPDALEVLEPAQINRKAAMRDTPALIKSYLKLGGAIGQGVFVDHAFNTTDVCLILDAAQLTPDAIRPVARHRT
jgi:putative hemolysin